MSLTRLDETLHRSGAAVASHLGPGIGATTVEGHLARLDLVPSGEVLTWFSWHNGAADPHVGLLDCELAPGVYLYDLATLCDEYISTRRDFDEVAAALPPGIMTSSDLWNPSWFPLARLDAGYIAVDLTAGRTGTSPVHAAWFDADAEHKDRPQWPTVDAFVRQLIERYEDGTYTVDANGGVRGPDVDEER